MLKGNRDFRDVSRACQLSFLSQNVDISTSSAQQQSMREAELQFDIRAFLLLSSSANNARVGTRPQGRAQRKAVDMFHYC
jgi:hypothetical protein